MTDRNDFNNLPALFIRSATLNIDFTLYYTEGPNIWYFTYAKDTDFYRSKDHSLHVLLELVHDKLNILPETLPSLTSELLYQFYLKHATDQVSFYIALDLGMYHRSDSLKEYPTLLELLQDTQP